MKIYMVSLLHRATISYYFTHNQHFYLDVLVSHRDFHQNVNVSVDVNTNFYSALVTCESEAYCMLT